MPRASSSLLGGLLALVLACSPAGAPADTPARQPTGTPAPAASDPASPTPSLAPTSAPSSPGSGPEFTPAASTPSPGTPLPPAAPAWRQLSELGDPAPREDHTLTVSGDGSVAYLFGGRAGRAEFDDLWRYDLASAEWTELQPAGARPRARFGHTAVWVEGSGLVVWSGQAGPRFFADAWSYDPEADAWRELPANGDVPPARYGSCAGVGPDGRMWISHGFTEDTGRFSDTRAYDFGAGSWTDMTPDGDRPVERCLHDCLWTPDGRLLVYAGQTTGAPAIGDLWAYRPAETAWLQAARPEPEARQLYALAQADGAAIVFGGGANDGSLLADLWSLDLESLAWSELLPLGESPAARSGATLIADVARGRLLLFGGKGVDGELGDLWELVLGG